MVAKSISPLAKRLWSHEQPAFQHFQKSLEASRAAQLHKLKKYISNNKITAFGFTHDFEAIRCYEEYATKVPLQNYESMAPYVQDIVNGKENVLTEDKVIALEETSGTTSASKLIPYTSTLQQEFEKAVSVWMTALADDYPSALNGKFYWSLSPPLRESRKAPCGLKIGLDNDLEYFSAETASIIQYMLAIDSLNAQYETSADFFEDTVLRLLACENLSFISVWSPTFFLKLDEALRQKFPEILERLNASIPNERRQILSVLSHENFTWKDLFPNLSIFSSWADAQASLWLPKVKELLGNVRIQNKGLLSTEGIVSIPVDPDFAPILAIDSHFYEFKAVDSDQILLCDELEIGSQYEVIITTGGGLYRYQTSDIVEVTDFYREGVPALRFMGRNNAVSDCVGEKLSEQQILEAFSFLYKKERCNNYRCLFLSPSKRHSSFQYQVYIEATMPIPDEQLQRIAKTLESVLTRNPYYKQALKLGQLLPLICVQVGPDFRNQLIENIKESKKIKEGDIKLPVIYRPEAFKKEEHGYAI